MRIITDRANPDTIASTLAVFLPAAYNTPEDFQGEGFISVLRERDLPIDCVLADMNLECISSGNALTQLHEEIVLPARRKGYSNIWLIGISIGGFMASLYVDKHVGEVNGLFLIAPYPGSRMITEKIHASGGLDRWSPEIIPEDDYEARFWSCLKHNASHEVDVYLGFGEDDRFADAHQEMSRTLPPNHICTLPGGHDWHTWKKLWVKFLDQGVFK